MELSETGNSQQAFGKTRKMMLFFHKFGASIVGTRKILRPQATTKSTSSMSVLEKDTVTQ